MPNTLPLCFHTSRLLIRPTDYTDAVLIYELFNTPKWIRFIGDRNIDSVCQAGTYIAQRIRPQIERLGYGSYTLIQESDGIKIGLCGLYDREGVAGIDLGFALLPAYEGKGFAFEAATCLKDAAFKIFDLTFLSAITNPSNTSSQALLEKLAFQFQGQTFVGDEQLMLYRLDNNVE